MKIFSILLLSLMVPACSTLKVVEQTDLLFRDAFQVHGADPGGDRGFHGIQYLADDPPAAAHLFNL